MKRKRATEQEHREWIERYLNGETARSISKDYSYNENTISKYIKNQGISRGKGKIFNILQNKDKIIAEYLKDRQATCTSLGKKYGLCDRTVSEILKQAGIKIKGVGKPTTCNENYFDEIDNPNKAYLLGFITADGAIVFEKNSCGDKTHGSLSIEIHQKDRDFLEFAKQEINPDAKIKDINYQNKNNCRITFNSTQLCKTLEKYGIVQNKSKIIEKVPTDKIPKQLLPYYFRGLIDGDGCILKNGTINIYSGSEKFIKDVQTVLCEEAGVKKLGIYKGTSFFIGWGGKIDKEKMFHYLYDNLNDTFYYKRKFQRLRDFLYGNPEITN